MTGLFLVALCITQSDIIYSRFIILGDSVLVCRPNLLLRAAAVSQRRSHGINIVLLPIPKGDQNMEQGCPSDDGQN